jgi:AraC-like DNA-binding protein
MTGSILLIFVTSFAINLILHYKNNSKVYFNELKNQNDILVKQFATTKELIIKSITTYTYNLVIDDIQFKNLLENFQYSYEEKKELSDKMQGFVNSNRYINSAYIYIPKDGAVLTTDIGMFFNENEFYDKVFLNKTDDSYLKLLEQREVNVLGKKYNYISIICSVKSKNNELLGIFVSNINADTVYKEAQSAIVVSERFNLLALDKNKKILYSNNIEQINRILDDNKDKMKYSYLNDKLISNFNDNGLISTYYSPSEKINYIIDLELKKFSSKNIFEYTVSSFLLTICLGFLLKLIMSQKLFKPLAKVITNIKNSYSIADGDSEIKVIENAFSDLIFKNVQLEDQYTQMLPIYREKLLHDIVVRKDYTIEEIKNKLAYYEMELKLQNYIVITLRVNKRGMEEEKNRMVKLLIKNKAEVLMQENYAGFCVETGKDDMTICLSLKSNVFDDVDYDAIVEFAELVVSLIKEELRIMVNAGIGSFVNSIEDIYKSYEESIESLNYNKMLKKSVGAIYEIKKINKNIFEYPYDLEYKLLSYMKIGDYNKSYFYLDNIFDTVQKQNMLTDSEIESIIFLLLGAINELIYQNAINLADEDRGVTKKLQMIRNNNLDDVKNELKIYITKIINVINVNKSNSSNIINQILKHIDENYTNELQLIDLEEEFKLNRYYIGQLIKENTGINFNDYINKKRIDKAVELLKTSDLPIKDISEAVGYKYPHYFIKLFKKTYGIAPGEYRSKAII